MNCKEKVYHGRSFRPSNCRKDAKRDGYCGQHHPDAVAARREKSSREFASKMQRDHAAAARMADERDKARSFDAVAAERDAYRSALQKIAVTPFHEHASREAREALAAHGVTP